MAQSTDTTATFVFPATLSFRLFSFGIASFAGRVTAKQSWCMVVFQGESVEASSSDVIILSGIPETTSEAQCL